MNEITNNNEQKGSVLILGAGVGGMQAALDLANGGFKVHLVQKDSAIGGTMSMLDKTFPTGDCAMCMISPRMVEVGGNPNIELHTLSEITDINGEAGNFTASILQQPRYVDPDKCTGCGICEEKCPKWVMSEFEHGLSKRKAIYSIIPQAVPNTKVIDAENCTYFKRGKCRVCEKFCDANAIDFSDTEKSYDLNVGSVILSPGLSTYNPESRQEFGYNRWKNVVTSIQFERILSASGPYQGEIVRPSDNAHPQKIAWIQCVGSRDSHNANPWCSSVCCMYATKQAIVAKEHDANIQPSIFYIDMRSFGKDFDKYIEQAKNVNNVVYKRSMISAVEEEVDTNNLILRYIGENGEPVDETFDLVVLSVGLEPNSDTTQFFQRLGIEAKADGFPSTSALNPVETSRKGIFVLGTYQQPKDIPETVVQGSATAAKAMTLLNEARGSEIVSKEYPSQTDIEDDELRIGIFVCSCGKNIGGVVDVSDVEKYAATLPGVAYATWNLFSCSEDALTQMKKAIQEHKLNRVVVASCSPQTHQPLFMETLEACGLNKYLFDMANIRNLNSWVHGNVPQEATDKAKDLIRMAVGRASRLFPLYEKQIPVIPKALVVGGGVSGLTASLSLADQGYEVYLIEREAELGGLARRLRKTMEGVDLQAYLHELINKVTDHPNIQVLTQAMVVGFTGFKGNFSTEILVGPAMYSRKLEHGATIIATGANEYTPHEYSYGQSDNVFTQIELESRLEEKGSSDLSKVVMIQCIGSRNEEYPICSRVCCQTAIKNALTIKRQNPNTEVHVLYRDIRTYGFSEYYYAQAREAGVRFHPFTPDNPPRVETSENQLHVFFDDQLLDRTIQLDADLLALSAGLRAEDTEELSSILKLARNVEGYFLEAHVKLRPVDMPTDGVFVCGTAHSPMLISESVSQALAAVSRANAILSQPYLTLSAVTAKVIQENCTACLVCARACPYGVPYINEDGVSEIDPALCQGCGICAAECPAKAIELNWYEDTQILSQIDSLLEDML